MSANPSRPPLLYATAEALGIGVLAFNFTYAPARQSQRLSDRIKMTAKLLGRSAKIQHSKALEAVSQAIGFASWHALSGHLTRATQPCLAPAWFDALAPALILATEPRDDVALPATQIAAFEHLGQTLAMLTDGSTQVLLDRVCAPLCAAGSWVEVRGRHPLRAKAPLYTFMPPSELLDPIEAAEEGGYFDPSAACDQLTEELDEQWQGYGEFAKPQQRRARQWVEKVLAAQPGFLEAGLALACMQRDAGEPQAGATATRFIEQAEALIPAGFSDTIRWAPLGNRIYHRLLWLRMELHCKTGTLPSAVKLARRQLKLNPPDNMGVRYVLPLLLLRQGDAPAAQRALRHMEGEPGFTACAIRAFTAFALGDVHEFRRELTEALFTLPWLRIFLLNQRTPLPDGDDGFRSMHPDTELFTDFAWPVYTAMPGLRDACRRFLAEPGVQQAEAELRAYWRGYWTRDRAQSVGSGEGWDELLRAAIVRVGRAKAGAAV